jgi:hypothetical protein
MAFATSRFPGADEANAVTALGEHDRKQAMVFRMAQQDEPRLNRRVARVLHDPPERIDKGRYGFVEGDPVLPRVPRGLARIPFEGEGHAGSYADREARGMRLTTLRISCGRQARRFEFYAPLFATGH